MKAKMISKSLLLITVIFSQNTSAVVGSCFSAPSSTMVQTGHMRIEWDPLEEIFNYGIQGKVDVALVFNPAMHADANYIVSFSRHPSQQISYSAVLYGNQAQWIEYVIHGQIFDLVWVPDFGFVPVSSGFEGFGFCHKAVSLAILRG